MYNFDHVLTRFHITFNGRTILFYVQYTCISHDTHRYIGEGKYVYDNPVSLRRTTPTFKDVTGINLKTLNAVTCFYRLLVFFNWKCTSLKLLLQSAVVLFLIYSFSE